MDVTEKLSLLSATNERDSPSRCVNLLKVLQTNFCTKNCYYCEFRADRAIKRTAFKSDELARLFFQMYKKRAVDGLFLSSGITANVNTITQRMLDSVEILRNKYLFKGYIHLKILPGVSTDYIRKSVELADRVSVNLEAPNELRLTKLANQKSFNDNLGLLRMISGFAKGNLNILRAGQITQFVIGPAGETDREVLSTVAKLYKELNLRRAYFSAFAPVSNTPLEECPPTSSVRGHRLYQADWLIRYYKFTFDELIFDDTGNLPKYVDPKLVRALANMDRFPIDVNKAEYDELMRVPGIGPVTARRIIEVRCYHKIQGLDELRKLGVIIRRAKGFLTLKDNCQLALPGFKIAG